MSVTSVEIPDGTGPAKSAEPLRHPGVDELDLAAVLHALSDPMRLKIVRILAGGGEHACKSIALPVTKSTCTHHFRVLREAGVMTQRLEGTTRMNALRRADLDARFPGLLDAVLTAATTD
jgi:DNA-binding transcriptional ArsR family regulator